MKKILVIFSLILLMMPVIVLAQTTTPNPCAVQNIGGQSASSTLPLCVNQIYKWALGLSVLLAMLMIVLGGYFIMTASGNAEQSSKGKEYITSALIGVVILFAAYLLLYEINPDLVDFNLNSLDRLNTPTQTTK